MTDKRHRGRPTIGDAPMKRINVMLDQGTIDVLKKVGDGNVSKGIRELALDKHEELESMITWDGEKWIPMET